MMRLALVVLLLSTAGCVPEESGGASTEPVSLIPRYTGPLPPTDARQVSGMNYDPLDLPLAWLPDQTILVAHEERYSSADVFASTCNGSGFYMIAEAGGAVRPVRLGEPGCEAASANLGIGAAPDGDRVVYSLITPPNNSRLVSFDLTLARLDTLVTDCRIYIEAPAFSADGSRIAAQGICNNRSEEWAIYTLNPDGTDLRLIAADTVHSYWDPAWAPDGVHLAFSVGDRARERMLIVGDTAGNLRELGVRGSNPVWSPDGEWIAFLAEDSAWARLSVRVVRTDGSDERVIFRNALRSTYSRGWGPMPEGEPAAPLLWSPDARSLAFRRSFDRGSSVWAVKIGSGDARQITAPDR